MATVPAPSPENSRWAQRARATRIVPRVIAYREPAARGFAVTPPAMAFARRAAPAGTVMRHRQPTRGAPPLPAQRTIFAWTILNLSTPEGVGVLDSVVRARTASARLCCRQLSALAAPTAAARSALERIAPRQASVRAALASPRWPGIAFAVPAAALRDCSAAATARAALPAKATTSTATEIPRAAAMVAHRLRRAVPTAAPRAPAATPCRRSDLPVPVGNVLGLRSANPT